MIDLSFIPSNFNFNISNLDILSTVFFLFLIWISRLIVVVLHECGHWIAGFFRGKIKIKIFPGISGKVEWENQRAVGDDDPLIKKAYHIFVSEAGCIVNMAFAIAVIRLFPILDLNNWYYIFIFNLGLVGLLGTAFNIGWGQDHTAVLNILGVHNKLIRILIGLILAIVLLYLFKDYYLTNLFELLMNLQNPNFIFEFPQF